MRRKAYVKIKESCGLTLLVENVQKLVCAHNAGVFVLNEIEKVTVLAHEVIGLG